MAYDINAERKKMHELLLSSRSILISSHEGADIDAVVSCLLLREILTNQYPHIQAIQIRLLAPKQSSISNLENLEEIENTDAYFVESVNDIADNFDTIAILDTEHIFRCFPDFLEAKLTDKNIIVIDHHDSVAQKHKRDVLVNVQRASTTQELYKTFQFLFGDSFKITDHVASLTQIGMVADTHSFIYEKTSSETFRVMEELRDKYIVSPEKIIKAMYDIPLESIDILIDIMKNIRVEGDMAHSYMSPELVEKHEYQTVKAAKGFFCDYMLRFLHGVKWGFLLTPKDQVWSLSLRSLYGTINVREIAERLGGGGHIYGAGAYVAGTTVEDAIKKVLDAYEISRQEIGARGN